MEKLKSLIPNDLERVIAESTSGNVTSTCALLLEFLHPVPQFQRVLGELIDPEKSLCRKSTEAALESKRIGNECFAKGDYAEALNFYSRALRHTPMTSEDMDDSLLASLYVNRASSMHKMGLLEECIRDCSRAIVHCPVYSKAWYRRGKANASLKNYELAVRDLEVSLSMEGSSTRKNQIKEELCMLLGHLSRNGRTNSCVSGEHKKLADLAEPHDIVLQCVTTPPKGRGMVSPNDILPSSLLHTEEPLAG